MTSRPSSWLYEERRLSEVGGKVDGPLRLARPTLEGEEPERERGGVCTDIMADWINATKKDLLGKATQKGLQSHIASENNKLRY